MQTQLVLIIEDEPKVAAFVKNGLETSGFATEVANDGLLGKKMALANKYDGIILDINLPHINGFEICKEIRSRGSKIPILMLSAMGTIDDKLTGFNLGADDYLVKPFEFRELLARLKVLLNRAHNNAPQRNLLKIANLELNTNSKTAKRGEKKIDLTAKEYMLLEYLLVNKGRVVSKTEIADKIWNIKFDTGTNVIEVYVNFLRKKIDKDFIPKLIHTHIGMGYVLKEE